MSASGRICMKYSGHFRGGFCTQTAFVYNYVSSDVDLVNYYQLI